MNLFIGVFAYIVLRKPWVCSKSTNRRSVKPNNDALVLNKSDDESQVPYVVADLEYNRNFDPPLKTRCSSGSSGSSGSMCSFNSPHVLSYTRSFDRRLEYMLKIIVFFVLLVVLVFLNNI